MIPVYAASSKVTASLRISYTTDTSVASVRTMIKTLAAVCAMIGECFVWCKLTIHGLLLKFLRFSQVLKRKQISDKTTVGLYSAMSSAHTSASREEVIKNREHLRPFYESLFKQTMECAIFLEGYITKNTAGWYLYKCYLYS